jgi:hypothetical protein
MLIRIPDALWVTFERCLTGDSVAADEWQAYRKGLRFYQDFCRKYGPGHADAGSLELFLATAESKSPPP